MTDLAYVANGGFGPTWRAGAFPRRRVALVLAATAAGRPAAGQAAAAGYSQSSSQVPGVGTHWIDWTLVDRPFDPARPSMLLFDERPGRRAHLAGFSHWLRSTTAPGGAVPRAERCRASSLATATPSTPSADGAGG